MFDHAFESALQTGAEENPDRMFCAFGGTGERLGYGEIRERVERCVAALRIKGVGPGTRIALSLPTSPELLVHLLAAMQCRALAVPFDPSAHPDMEDAMMRVLDPHLVVRMAGNDVQPGPRESGRNCAWSWRTAAGPLDETIPARLGIFTSGSTGVPKCVLLSASNLRAGACFVAEAHRITAADTALCLMPLNHVNGVVTTILAPLLTRSAVVFLQHSLSARRVLEALERWDVTWMSAAPAHYRVLLYAAPKPGAGVACRFARSASAPLPGDVKARFENLYGIPIIETMGLTECSGQVFANPLEPSLRKAGSVGRAVGNQADVVGVDDRPLRDGEVGEIRVRGPNVMLGYLGAPAETAEVLRDGWLHTGDLGYRDADGFFYVTGRKKLIAIVAGINVSLEAVGTLASRVVGVDEAAAVARSDAAFGEVIDLYYAGSAAAGATARRIREAVAPALPHHLALRHVTHVAALPRSASGKLLRHQLVDESRSKAEL